MTQMPETIYVEAYLNGCVCGVHDRDVSKEFGIDDLTKYHHNDKYEALKQSYDRLCHLLENYTFLDEGMDAGTRAEIYAESKKALAEAEKVSGK